MRHYPVHPFIAPVGTRELPIMDTMTVNNAGGAAYTITPEQALNRWLIMGASKCQAPSPSLLLPLHSNCWTSYPGVPPSVSPLMHCMVASCLTPAPQLPGVSNSNPPHHPCACSGLLLHVPPPSDVRERSEH